MLARFAGYFFLRFAAPLLELSDAACFDSVFVSFFESPDFSEDLSPLFAASPPLSPEAVGVFFPA